MDELTPVASEIQYPLSGFRIWRITKGPLGIGGWGLYSMVQAVRWDMNEGKAICLAYEGILRRLMCGHRTDVHKPPGLRCGCGYYGYSSLDAAMSEHTDRVSLTCTQRSSDILVVGVATFWGPTVIGSVKKKPGYRYRARFAQVKGFLDNPREPRVRMFAEQNGISLVKSEDHLKMLAAEHGQTL